MTQSPSDLIAGTLRELGVPRLFGVPGGGANLDLIGSGKRVGMKFVLAHSESSACIMASTFGLLTETPGVAVVTRGPGITSAVTGLAQATLDRFPLVLISDTVTSESKKRIAHQSLDEERVTAAVTKWSGRLGWEGTAGNVRSAGHLALTGPYGAVHLAYDPSVCGDSVPIPPVYRLSGCPPERMADLVRSAKFPVVIVGREFSTHAATIRTRLRGAGVPVLTTYEAKGLIPDSWPCHAGLFTGGAMERSLLEAADLVVAVGVDPAEPLATQWSYAAPVVALQAYPNDVDYFGSDQTLTDPGGKWLGTLLASLEPRWEEDIGRTLQERGLAELRGEQGDQGGFGAIDVVEALLTGLGGSIATVDAGAHMLAVMPIWQAERHNDVLISNGLATMGFALPAAVGAALARPDSRVVCFVGDGGIGMVLAELETLARLSLNVVVVVFNDGGLSLIRLKQRSGQGGQDAVGYVTGSFSGVAEALGVGSAVVSSRAELIDVVGRLQGGPYLIDARVDPAGYEQVLRASRG